MAECSFENAWVRAARVGMILLLMSAPLAFGAVQTWAWGSIVVAVWALFLVWAIGSACSRILTVSWSEMYFPALALLLIGCVQLAFHLTLDPIATREAVLKLLAYIAVFFLTQQLLALQGERGLQTSEARERDALHTRVSRSVTNAEPVGGARSVAAVIEISTGAKAATQPARHTGSHGHSKLETFALAVSIYGFLVALFAIIQYLATPGLLYFIRQPQWGGWVFGPYVNHNHYAGLMEMLIPIALGYLIARRAPSASTGSARGRRTTSVILMFLVLISIVSVLLSGSRAGVVALVVELALFMAAVQRDNRRNGDFLIGRKANTRIWLGGACLLLLVAVVFAWIDPGEIVSRWESTAHTPEMAFQYRMQMTRDTLRMTRDHLVLGVGLGAFETAYPVHQTIATDLIIDYAHDDYAQLLAETGILGSMVAFIAAVMFFRAVFRWFIPRSPGSRPRITSDRWIQIGAAAGICGILVHSFFDFNLHMPANAAWFACCCGIALIPSPVPSAQHGNLQ